MLALMIVAVCVAWVRAGDIVTVEGGGASGLPPQIQGTGLTMSFCAVSGKECKGTNISKKFAPAASECMKRCGKDPKCLNAFYSNEKICHLRKGRCDAGSRVDSPGAIYFHRVKDGESCPAATPDYLLSITKYSKSFCLMKGKSCKGRDLYKRPQKINKILDCLKKCVGINECSMVDYSPGQCALKGDKCEDTELKDTEGTENYLRLEDNVLHCPGNREVPAQTLQPQPAGPPPEDPKEEICVETVVTLSQVKEMAKREIQHTSSSARKNENERTQNIRAARRNAAKVKFLLELMATHSAQGQKIYQRLSGQLQSVREKMTKLAKKLKIREKELRDLSSPLYRGLPDDELSPDHRALVEAQLRNSRAVEQLAKCARETARVDAHEEILRQNILASLGDCSQGLGSLRRTKLSQLSPLNTTNFQPEFEVEIDSDSETEASDGGDEGAESGSENE